MLVCETGVFTVWPCQHLQFPAPVVGKTRLLMKIWKAVVWNHIEHGESKNFWGAGGGSRQNNFFIRFIFENFKLQLSYLVPEETTVYNQSYLKNTVMLLTQLFVFCIIGCMDFCKHICVLSCEDRKHLAHGYHLGFIEQIQQTLHTKKKQTSFFLFLFFSKHTDHTERKIRFLHVRWM